MSREWRNLNVLMMAWGNKSLVIFTYIILHNIGGIIGINDVSTDVHKIDQSKYRVHVLLPGLRFRCCPTEGMPLLEIFCYVGRPKHVAHVWETVTMEVALPEDQFELYSASSARDVVAEFELHRSSWSLNPFPGWRRSGVRFDPFNSSCAGVSTTHRNYAVYLHAIRVDYWLVLLQLTGVVLYLGAPRLSDNPLFYYLCGVSLGICTSFLVLVYLLSRLFPKRPLMYGFVVGGWAVGVYVLQMLWDNLRVILHQYRSQVAVYCAVTGLLSFVVCYRTGPVTDPRTKNLIRWTLQAASFTMLYCGTYYHEAAIASMMMLTALSNFPHAWLAKIKTVWKRKFPPKVPLLTEDEYHEQAAKETKKALDELRGYCSSPDCNAWRTVLKLKSPVRFAQFMDGSSHLNDQEMMGYENESRNSADLLTDDSESD